MTNRTPKSVSPVNNAVHLKYLNCSDKSQKSQLGVVLNRGQSAQNYVVWPPGPAHGQLLFGKELNPKRDERVKHKDKERACNIKSILCFKSSRCFKKLLVQDPHSGVDVHTQQPHAVTGALGAAGEERKAWRTSIMCCRLSCFWSSCAQPLLCFPTCSAPSVSSWCCWPPARLPDHS
ncbi:hypothetical protein E2C01_016559 [Portunus trituberculatus]|uniref:Uncharacterized protein n=1 Tax=Portunus trituberculatus TaxID=210409 RepID=A0A5B7DPX6_PORTR|nr:hypothetical protein [Portunus trituberculatus]